MLSCPKAGVCFVLLRAHFGAAWAEAHKGADTPGGAIGLMAAIGQGTNPTNWSSALPKLLIPPTACRGGATRHSDPRYMQTQDLVHDELHHGKLAQQKQLSKHSIHQGTVFLEAV